MVPYGGALQLQELTKIPSCSISISVNVFLNPQQFLMLYGFNFFKHCFLGGPKFFLHIWPLQLPTKLVNINAPACLSDDS